MTPIIGMLGEVDAEKSSIVQTAYLQSIENAGGTPILLPYVAGEGHIARFAAICDGFVFTGGADVDPKRYGEEVKETCGGIDYLRDDLEFRTFAAAIQTGKPILAICRGIQLVNVALGGTLYQDLPTEFPTEIFHRQKEAKFSPSHRVFVNENTPLHTLMGADSMQANSFHHQAIKELAPGLEIMATAEDGIIEAVYGRDTPYLRGYQWHPERLADKNEQNRLIFEDFVRSCGKK